MWPKILLFAAITQVSLYLNDLYEFKYNDDAHELTTRLTRSIGITSIALAVVYLIWPEMIIGRWIFFSNIMVVLLLLVAWRLLYVLAIKKRLLVGKALLIGDGELAKQILDEATRNKDASCLITCLIAPAEAHAGKRGNGAHVKADWGTVVRAANSGPTEANYVDYSGLSLVSTNVGHCELAAVKFSEALITPDHDPVDEDFLQNPQLSACLRLDNRENREVECHRGLEKICELAEAYRINHIIVALDEKRGVFPYKQLLDCKIKGMRITEGENFYESISGKLLVEKMNPAWLIFCDGFARSRLYRTLKSLIDLLLSAVLLIFTSPLLFLTAVAIKLDSIGPVLISQDRVGEYGRIFKIHKFRSMRVDAEKMTGPVWASENDPRVTRVGRVIRRLRIDELPQLWNVFKGEMSFVGPRPERPFFVEELRKKIPYYDERSAVKPGITGWAQIKYRYGSSEKDALEKLKYDLYYIKNMSILLDLIILFETAKTVLLGRGAR